MVCDSINRDYLEGMFSLRMGVRIKAENKVRYISLGKQKQTKIWSQMSQSYFFKSVFGLFPDPGYLPASSKLGFSESQALAQLIHSE